MNEDVDRHYRQDGLTARIQHELARCGYDLSELRPGDLAGVDEFHLGGRAATDALLGGLGLSRESRILDVGCGIGGAARTVASTIGCSVTGVDLTNDFVETATDLSVAVGMDDTTTFTPGDALDLPFGDGEFDAVLMLHVGMNISDKVALMAELARVLRSGGTLVVYDIMRVGEGEMAFPVPWASGPSTSFLAAPLDYRDAMFAAGLEPGTAVDRLDLVRSALKAASRNPPPVNLSHLMGEGWPTMFANLVAALDAGVVSPTEIVARRPSEPSPEAPT